MKFTLTADMCAHAIIAAAKVYGDDPIRAVSVKSGVCKRSLGPAAFGLGVATNCSEATAARVMNVQLHSIRDARFKSSKAKSENVFEKAIVRAAKAVYAHIRAEPAAAPRVVVQSLPPEPPKAAPIPAKPSKPRVIAPAVATKPSPRLAAVPISSSPKAPHRPAPRPGTAPVARPAVPSTVKAVVKGMERSGAVGQFTRLSREHHPDPTSSKISDADRALIEAAMTERGVQKLPTGVADGAEIPGLKLKDHPRPLEYDRDTKRYSRKATA